jgi:hypothetical protein
MSKYKNFEKYLKGEWYPGCTETKSEWRKNIEADFAARGIGIQAPVVLTRKPPQYKKIDKRLCPGCGARMNQNLYGICRNCARKFRGLIEQTLVMVCDEPGCTKTLRSDCKSGKCSTHHGEVRKMRRQQRKEEMRAAA